MKLRTAYFFALFAVLFVLQAGAQDRKLQMHAVAFYNLENLFDTCHDAGKNDWEFLPDGTYHWTKIKYEHKLANMSRVISELGTDKLAYGASIIGVSEVENSKALDDLMAQPKMQKRGYRYIHLEGPDKRGVDCALIYNPRAFKVVKTFNKDYVYENGDTVRRTRPFFCVQGKLAGDNVTVVVCHWPSRAAEGVFREYGGRQVRALTDSISNADPTQHIIVMGDMNTTPVDDMRGMCNMMLDLHHQGQGTHKYQGQWTCLDQFYVSMILQPYSRVSIYSPSWLMEEDGKYLDYQPFRTYVGFRYNDGYSDHLPIVLTTILPKK